MLFLFSIIERCLSVTHGRHSEAEQRARDQNFAICRSGTEIQLSTISAVHSGTAWTNPTNPELYLYDVKVQLASTSNCKLKTNNNNKKTLKIKYIRF